MNDDFEDLDDAIDVVEEVTTVEDEDGNLITEDVTVAVDEQTGDAVVDDLIVVEGADGSVAAEEIVTAVDADGVETVLSDEVIVAEVDE